MFKDKNVDKNMKVNEERKWHIETKTVSAFVSHDKNECVVCGKVYKGGPDQFYKMIKNSKIERLNIIKSKNLCFSSLNKGCHSNIFKSKGSICKGNHHHLF